jgi:hypothetical protein
MDGWYKAMDLELEALNNKNTMTEILRMKVPPGEQIVRSTWAFCRKRRPSGEVYK